MRGFNLFSSIVSNFPFPAVPAPKDNLEVPQKYRLDYLSAFSGTSDIPTATVKLTIDGQTIQETAIGVSVIDAIFNAIGKSVSPPVTVVFWSCPMIFRKRKDMAEFRLRLSANGKSAMGYSMSIDLVEAVGAAYIDGLNRLTALAPATETTTAITADSTSYA